MDREQFQILEPGDSKYYSVGETAAALRPGTRRRRSPSGDRVASLHGVLHSEVHEQLIAFYFSGAPDCGVAVDVIQECFTRERGSVGYTELHQN